MWVCRNVAWSSCTFYFLQFVSPVPCIMKWSQTGDECMLMQSTGTCEAKWKKSGRIYTDHSVAAEDTLLEIFHLHIPILTLKLSNECVRLQGSKWNYALSLWPEPFSSKFLSWHFFLLACNLWKSRVRYTQACAQVKAHWGILVAINKHLVPQETTFYCLFFIFHTTQNPHYAAESETTHASCLTTQIKI